MARQIKQNWFNTLSEALESENLQDTWELHYPALAYESNFTYNFDDGTRFGRHVSIYRDSRGMYERPIHYSMN